MFNVAILGRPNVGKSTLYNRLVGKKEAIVHDEPGVTRDRKYGQGSIGPLEFAVIDTPGLEDLGKDSLAGRMTAQSMAALRDADVILFVIDARAGVTVEDEHFAKQLRQVGLPVVLVANKAESLDGVRDNLMDAYRLALGDPVPVSAEHGGGLAALYDALVPFHDEEVEAAEAEEVVEEEDEAEFDPHEEADESAPIDTSKPIQIAIVGRPNVGKSTLVNSLLHEDRVLAGPEAGMTRDAVSVDLIWEGRAFTLVDTAGLRRKSKIDESLEQLSVGSTLNALRYAEVAVLMLDATTPLEKQDNVIAGLIEREGRACVIALNKADQIPVNEAYIKALRRHIENVVPQMRGITVVPMVATEGKGVDDLMEAICETHRIWNIRLSTSKLNNWLETLIDQHSPPLVGGRRLKFRYMTQTKARPPTFVIFSNKNKEVPDSYLRYLTNQLRESFGMQGVPIRLLLRTGKNPYVK
jgi:GTPase